MKHSHRCKGPPDGYIGYVGSVRRSFIGLDKVGYKISGQLPRTERKPGIRKNSIINMEFFCGTPSWIGIREYFLYSSGRSGHCEIYLSLCLEYTVQHIEAKWISYQKKK